MTNRDHVFVGLFDVTFDHGYPRPVVRTTAVAAIVQELTRRLMSFFLFLINVTLVCVAIILI